MEFMDNPFSDKRSDVEHAINLYAHSFVVMPAFGIYDDEIVSRFEAQIRSCHIYMIGLLPTTNLVHVEQVDQELVTSFDISGERYDLRWPVPAGSSLAGGSEEGWYLTDETGRRFFPSSEAIIAELRRLHPTDFQVLYIGQAFGEDGSRNALDRLRKHETLKKLL